MKASFHAWGAIAVTLLLCPGGSQASDTVYAGLIDPYCQMIFMVSMDGAQTWTQQTIPGGNMEIHSITPVPETPGAFYISQGSGIYLSTDYGQSWSADLFPYNNITYVHDLEIDSLDPYCLWATSTVWPLSSNDTLGVFLSMDSGTTWEYGGEGIPHLAGASVQAYCLAVGTGSPRIGYVGTWEAIGDSTIGVYKRDLSSDTTRWQYSGLSGEGPINDIIVDPVDQNLCFALAGYCSFSAGALWRTIDGGVSWEIVLDADSLSGIMDWDFEYLNGTLYVPVFGKGMYISTDNGYSWECCSVGLNLSVSCVSASILDSQNVYAGCQSIVGPPFSNPFYKSIDEGSTWFQSCNMSQLLWCVLIKCGFEETSVVDSDCSGMEAIPGPRISPNPCHASTDILYCTEISCFVTIDLYDICGRKIEEIFSGYRSYGEYVERLDTSRLLPGIYFLKISGDGNDMMQKLVVI
ncbi:MAG: T9SS type A sorting domain-containing protein [Candidatus Aegiribacteria sp.]|nr:T9SS type A sorting domain-containing protein [Candidatus Aegiribacteria sp.]